MTVEWWAAISRGVMDGLGEDGRRTRYGIIAPHGVHVRVWRWASSSAMPWRVREIMGAGVLHSASAVQPKEYSNS